MKSTDAKSTDEKATTTEVPPVVKVVASPPSSSDGVSISTLLVLLILSSVLSSAFGPLMQSGLRSLAEIYLGIPPNSASTFHQQKYHNFNSQHPPQSYQVQHTQQNVPLASQVHTADVSSFQCKHNYRAYITHRDPLVIYLEGFLQEGEADHMISVAAPKMERSPVIGESKYSSARTSSSAFLDRSADAVIHCIEQRASLVSNISIEATEPLQVVWYTVGQEFRPHHDYLDREDLAVDYWAQWGQRYTTFLVYLNEPEQGGSTIFPDLGLDIKPKKNDAIFWYNVGIDELEDVRTLHGGSPVEGGEKYAINIWQRKPLPDLPPYVDSNEVNTDQPPNDSEPINDKTQDGSTKEEL